MALADYRLCDICEGKAFYDERLNYEPARTADDPMSTRWVGETEPWGVRLDYLGDWAVLCSDCAKTHKCVILPR